MINVEFESKNTGTLLKGRLLRAEETKDKSPLMIILTGDGRKGTKSLSWVNMPPKLEEVGISSFLFDFEGLGYSEGERKNLSLSIGIDNFKSAYNFIKQIDWINKEKIGVFASSFGACVLLMSPEIANELRAIGLKSPAAFIADAYYYEVGMESFNKWRTDGYLEENGYNFEIFIDALNHNVYRSAMGITSPCLITQGDNDEIIPLQQTIFLYECLNSEDKHLEIFKGASHGYSEGDSWDRMAKLFVDWFKENL